MFDFNNEIYGTKKLRQGEHADFMIESIQQQEMKRINIDTYNDKDALSNLNKEIKF